MQDIKGSKFIVTAFLLSLIMIISIVAKFSFSLSAQMAIFLLLTISTLFLINKYKFKNNSYIVPSTAFVVVSFISYFGADFQTNARDYIIVLLSALLAGFNFTFLSFEMKKKVLMVPIFIALWLSMILFSRFITNPQGFFYGDDFYEAIALNINVIAGFLVLVYPLIYIYIKDKSNSKIFISMLVFILLAIFLTRSRMAILSSFVMTIIFLFEYRKNIYIKIAMATIAALLIVAIIYISELKISFNSVPERLVWWKTAYLIFKENIFFGCGFGNYSVLFKAFRPELVLNTLYAHNIIMQLLSDTGIFGLLSCMFILLSFYKKVIDEIINAENSYYYVVIAVSVTSFMIINLVDYSFFVPANMMIFFIVFCSVFSAEAEPLKKEKINSYILVAAFVVFAIFIVKPVIAQTYYKKGINFYVAKQYKLAIEEFEQALKLDKKNPEYYYQIANSQFALFDQNRGETGKIYIDEAIKYTKQAIHLHKYGAQLRASLASLYWNNNKKDEAVKAMEEALQYDKFNPYFEEYYFQLKNS